jgi:hypothetical protein
MRTFNSSLQFTAIVLGLMAVSSSHAGTFSVIPFHNDADIGISSATTYTHAVDFTGAPVVNGVPFIAGGSGVFPGGQNNIPNPLNTGAGLPAYVTGGANDLLSDFMYGNTNAFVRLDGLVPGNTYETRFYHRLWDPEGDALPYDRTQWVAVDVTGDGIADESTFYNADNPVAHVGGADTAVPTILSYQFTAAAPSVNFAMSVYNPDAATYHLYALTNQLVAPGPPPPPPPVPPPVPATPIPGLYNTGVDDAGAPLPDNVDDPHYSLLGVDIFGPGNVMADATLVADGFPIPPWIANSATSRWIGPAAADANGPAGYYYWEIQFDMTGLRPETAVIRGQWATDNYGHEILLNGVPTGNLNTTQFVGLTPFEIGAYLGDQFVDGLNSLIFVVNNAPGGASNPTGLRVEGLMAGAEIIPEPSTVALAGLAITLVLAGRIRRFKRR